MASKKKSEATDDQAKTLEEAASEESAKTLEKPMVMVSGIW